MDDSSDKYFIGEMLSHLRYKCMGNAVYSTLRCIQSHRKCGECNSFITILKDADDKFCQILNLFVYIDKGSNNGEETWVRLHETWLILTPVEKT